MPYLVSRLEQAATLLCAATALTKTVVQVSTYTTAEVAPLRIMTYVTTIDMPATLLTTAKPT
jgi:hypothetical protein